VADRASNNTPLKAELFYGPTELLDWIQKRAVVARQEDMCRILGVKHETRRDLDGGELLGASGMTRVKLARMCKRVRASESLADGGRTFPFSRPASRGSKTEVAASSIIDVILVLRTYVYTYCMPTSTMDPGVSYYLFISRIYVSFALLQHLDIHANPLTWVANSNCR
jgi:hypothetical protein